MSIDEIASEAFRLPPEQRALLAESLWESLDDSSATLALALERDRQIETGEVQEISHDEMMAKLRL
jgi:hypothetical protein